MSKKVLKSLRQARVDHRSKVKKFSKKVRSAISKLDLTEADRDTLNALLGQDGRAERPLCSDIMAVKRSASILARTMRKELRDHPGRSYFHLTLIDDTGTTSDRAPVVYLGFFEEKIRRALVSLKLDAFVMLEVHPLMNYPGGDQGRSLSYHAHAIAWSDEPFDALAAAKRINGSRAWNCSLGAPPVKIDLIGNTARDISQVAYYLIKSPHSAKNRMPDRKRPGRFILMDTTEGYREDLALRVFEGLTQIELTSMMFGVGQGKAVRQTVRAELENWQRSRPVTGTIIPASYDVWAMWYRLRQTFRSANYLPYRFDRAPLAKPPLSSKPVKRPRGSKPHSRSALEGRRRATRRLGPLRSRPATRLLPKDGESRT